MAIVSFTVAEADKPLVNQVVDRVLRELPDLKYDRKTASMDLCAVHANGCPMDWKKLLAAPAFDFTHDICGIQAYLNRSTGKLKGRFEPRCHAQKPVKPQKSKARKKASA